MSLKLQIVLNILPTVPNDIKEILFSELLLGAPNPKWGSPSPANEGRCYWILLAKNLVQSNTKNIVLNEKLRPLECRYINSNLQGIP